MRFVGAVMVAAGVACSGPRASPPVLTRPGAEDPAGAALPVTDGPPLARTVDVVDTAFGLSAPDPYRWMEGDPNPETAEFLAAQGAYAKQRLAALPERDALYARIRELGLGATGMAPPQLAGGRAFFLAIDANEQRPKLVVRDVDGRVRTLVEPGEGSIDNFRPSLDGAFVAYNATRAGVEISTLHVVDVATGKPLPDQIERVWGEFRAEWLPDGKSFFYTQMGPPGAGVDPMLGMRVRLHSLGTPADHDPVIVEGHRHGSFAIEPHEFPLLRMAGERAWVIARAVGARREIRVAVARLATVDRQDPAKTRWMSVADYDDNVHAADAFGDRLYLLSRKDAPNGRLLSVPLARPDLASARVELAEDRETVLENFAVAKDAIFVSELVDGYARVRKLPWGKPARTVELPFQGSVLGIATDPTRDGVTIQLTSWTRPSKQFHYDARTHGFVANGIESTSTADFSAITVERLTARAPDGESVPLTLVRRTDLVADGSHPAILRGYAAYGASTVPDFSGTDLAWLERGGVVAYCHGRGGSEKGDRWHRGGIRENKLVGIRDFVACGRALVEARWTANGKLGAIGVSAGGLLVARAMLEAPELFGAVVISVGFTNPLRMLTAQNGANQIAEFGDPSTEAGYRQLHAVDPYVHARPDARYPAVLFTVGLNDSRVPPWMTAKLAAKLQAGKPSRPVLVRTDTAGGHGTGSARDQQYAERADVFAFLRAQLR